MTLVIAFVLLAALLPFFFLLLSGVPATGTAARWGPGYDNDNPRASLSKLEGWRQRAHFAQQNGHEAFAPFVAALGLATWAQVSAGQVMLLGAGFLLCRLGHGFAYLAGSGRFRSLFWWGGFGAVLALFAAALRASP